MKTRAVLLTLVLVAALVGFGSWWLLFPRGASTPADEGIERPPAERELPTPALRGRDGEPAPAPVPAAPDTRPAPALLSVRVLDDARGRVLEGALVRVVQGEDVSPAYRTDQAGVAEVGDLQEGAVHVLVQAPSFVRAEEHRDLQGTEPIVIEVRLRRGVTAKGRVVARRTGLPVAGASVTVAPGGSLDGWTELSTQSAFGGALTDEEGRFAVDGVPPGKLVTVRASAEGYGAATESMRLAPDLDATPGIVLKLPPAAVLVGSVRQPTGESAVGARVYAVPADAPELLLANPEAQCVSNGRPYRALRAVADDEGAFRVQGLELGAVYLVFAESEGYGRSALREGVIATEENPQPRVELVLRGAASLTVRLWSPEGTPQAEGRLLLLGDGFPLELELRAPGVFVREEPPPGTYTLRVTCAGTVMQELSVEIQAAELREIEVRLERGLTLAGILVDDTGQPIAGQKLRVDRHWQESQKYPPSAGSAVTDEGGRFEIGGLRSGPHDVGLVLGRHVVPDDLRLVPPDDDVRLVVLRKAAVRVRVGLPAGHPAPAEVGIRVGREEDGGYGESGHRLPWNAGALFFEDLAPGEIRLRIQVEGLLEVVRELTLKPGEVADLGSIELSAGFELRGRVVDREDRPVAGARVSAGQVWTPTHRNVVTGADGGFALPAFGPGANRIEIAAAGFLPRTVEVDVPKDLDGRTFVLDRGCLVTVSVRDADGAPAPARRVRWRPQATSGDADGEDSEETDAKGLLEVRLREGAWTLEVLDDEWQPVTSREIEVTEGSTETVELALPR